MTIPLPDPPLADGSIALRPWREGDEKALAAAWSDPEIRRWTQVPARRSKTVAWRWIRTEPGRRATGTALDLVVVPVEGTGILGEVGLSHLDPGTATARVGYWTAPEVRGHGVATRAVRLLVSWAFDGPLGLRAVELEAHPHNVASLRVAEKAGFGPTGETRARATPLGPADLEVWSRRCS